MPAERVLLTLRRVRFDDELADGTDPVAHA